MKLKDAREARSLSILEQLLDEWVQNRLDDGKAQQNWVKSISPSERPAEFFTEAEAHTRSLVMQAAEQSRPFLPALLEDNSGKTSEELEILAGYVSPMIGAHNSGLFAQLLIPERHWIGLDALLLTAMVRSNWHGGKVGFQFLPDPADDWENYEDERWMLQEVFERELEGDPLRILTGNDREFFLSLPQRFTVYRGCAGISAERAAEGLCWTLKRDVADWFADRSAGLNGGAPVVVTATIRNSQIYFAKAVEFEIVAAPSHARPIKARRRKASPDMEWKPDKNYRLAGHTSR